MLRAPLALVVTAACLGPAPAAWPQDTSPEPLAVEWLTPTPGSALGGTVELSVRAADVRAVRAVRFLVNGKFIGERAQPPYALAWDTTQVPNGRHALQARAIDAAGRSRTTDPVAVTVANFNRRPVVEPIAAQAVAPGQALRVEVVATDPDGPRDRLTYAATGLPGWAQLDPRTGVIEGVPGAEELPDGQDKRVYADIQVSVCDPQPLCAAQPLAITLVRAQKRPAPALAPIPDQELREGQAWTLALDLPDREAEELTCKAKRLPAWAAFDEATCTFSGTPDFRVASAEEPLVAYPKILIEVCGPEPPCASQAVGVTVAQVNSPPAWQPLQVPPPLKEGKRMALEVAATDPEGDPLTLTATALPEGATFASKAAGRGILAWVPRSDQSGEHTVSITAGDGAVASQLTVKLTVRDDIVSVSGQIVNSLGRPGAGIRVKVLRGTSTVREAVTDAQGRYVASGLEPGVHWVRPVPAPMSRDFTSKGVAVPRMPDFEPSKLRVEIDRSDVRNIDFVMRTE